MPCARFVNTIQELADGTLGSIRRAELELHLDQCEDCRRFADDLARIRQAAASLDRPVPPDRVWLQIAGRLRQEGRVAAPAPLRAASRRFVPYAIAASVLLAVAASWFVFYQASRREQPQQAAGNAAREDAVQGVEAEFRLAEQHYQNAIAKLEEAFRNDNDTIDAPTAAMLKKNLEVIDQAIAESRAALRQEPQSPAALGALFDALKRKVIVLQDTIALMNQIRKGDAAGAAQLVDSVNKS